MDLYERIKQKIKRMVGLSMVQSHFKMVGSGLKRARPICSRPRFAVRSNKLGIWQG